MDTNKATPDLKPSAQPPSPEDLMEARRVDEEGSKVPARESMYMFNGEFVSVTQIQPELTLPNLEFLSVSPLNMCRFGSWKYDH